jgi:hypothetical protein
MLTEELVNVRLDRLVTHFAAAAAQDGLRSDRRACTGCVARRPHITHEMDRGLSQHACISPRVP